MITEQQLLDFMRETAYKPMTYHELEQHFDIQDAADFKAFLVMLTRLEEAGQILRTRSDCYGVPERMNLQRGRLQAHAKGFGFLIPDEMGHPDVYIHANDMKTAMHGDIVLVRITSKGTNGTRMEGAVVRVVKRAVEQIVGIFENHESYGFVIPDDKRINRDIFVAREHMHGAVTGQKVVVRIIVYPEGRAAAQGEVIEVLGHKDDPGVDILSIIRKHQLPEAFPAEVMAEAEGVPDAISEEEIVSQGRRDLRGMTIVTIDGEDAKDLDDAVHVVKLPNGRYELGVHIADVGYYVPEGSDLDREAYARGCSVYLVDRVIPMLPHRLSNGICSLHSHVDRLTLSCVMEFDEKMKLVRHGIFPSVIRTVERMTYTNVRKIVEDGDPEVIARYAELEDFFLLMKELALKLRKRRMQRGAIDFDFEESKVIVDEQGKPVDIVKRERSIAEQIIEEFMLAANETVAEHFHWLRVPFLYRIHEEPNAEKLFHFMAFAANFGYVVRGKGNSVHPRSLQTLLEEIEGTREQTVISTMMLRSMKQAKYDAESTGHFGLAAEFYTHFTSPIRRYPDLVIHRIIREVIQNGGTLSEKRQEYLHTRMSDIAQQSSERERVAVDAERDTEALKKAEFMLDKIGEEFDGIISSVTSFGMFVELENTVEGLIRLSDLTDDYYHFHEQHMLLVGERTSNIFRIGDEVRIRVGRVNLEDYTIDFELVSSSPRHSDREVRELGFDLRKCSRRGTGAERSGGRDTGRERGGNRAVRGDEHGGGRGRKGGPGAREEAAPQPWRGSRVGAGSQPAGSSGSDASVEELAESFEGEWYNQAEFRERQGRRGRGRRGNEPEVNPYERSSGKRARGKGGIHLGQSGGKEEKAGSQADGDNWADELIERAEAEAKETQRRFDFGSGRGGYGRCSSDAPSGGGKKGRKSTSESGIFIGEPAARGRKQAGQAGRKKRKASSQTAKFVRKKR
ncbi:ribonuclease R [Paenibacillus popilliae]|uniref:Ribonuclease R n=1 Tax=Paenibacillus popilliae ATCC 14706 TaxID=1212764 RepID=M9LPS2_PAEPP|nr:ribonuclease R [Paenibacillus popilliae]GAC42596.1 exoribonuclease R [Paenibacillus popilliae ATCC 14706]